MVLTAIPCKVYNFYKIVFSRNRAGEQKEEKRQKNTYVQFPFLFAPKKIKRNICAVFL
jgi:hypothetical protein